MKIVEHELKTDAKELIKAAISPPATKPFNPTGKSVLTRIGNAWSLFSKIITPCLSKAKAIIPGIKNIKMGSIFRYAPKIAPLLPILILLAASVLWTIYWSVHQYHIPTIVPPNNKPVHGKLGSLIGRHILKCSGPTVSLKLLQPPTSVNPR